jgi:hypothetical protein
MYKAYSHAQPLLPATINLTTILTDLKKYDLRKKGIYTP